jgi:hypothetical protein
MRRIERQHLTALRVTVVQEPRRATEYGINPLYYLGIAAKALQDFRVGRDERRDLDPLAFEHRWEPTNDIGKPTGFNIRDGL